jgi:hypothetical protein
MSKELIRGFEKSKCEERGNVHYNIHRFTCCQLCCVLEVETCNGKNR